METARLISGLLVLTKERGFSAEGEACSPARATTRRGFGRGKTFEEKRSAERERGKLASATKKTVQML
ncbi:hypothetical protein GN244_ATG07159 [Phytophthora infestans]|uniref:Uncharacterized protein n=1 Tax=Phytophthora infestans TaxID=4787 RepID=A0A833TGV5_PHYIN|nr:hypothetical protein GN244_ATG07159 [Phytophthora infestans]